MSLRKSIILGLVLLGALAYIFRVELPREEQSAREEFLLAGIGGESIEKIEILRPAGNFTLLNKTPKEPMQAESEAPTSAAVPRDKDAWQFESLPDAPVDSVSLNSLLTSLTSLKGGKAIKAEDISSDLGVYGLKQPEVALKVSYKQRGGSSQSLELQFGKKNEYLGERYLRVLQSPSSKEALYLVADTSYMAANKDLNSFRKRQLIEFSDSDVKSVSVTSKAGSLTFEPVEKSVDPETAGSLLQKSSWKITSPMVVHASNPAISDWLRALRTIKVKNFIDGEAAKLDSFGLSDPQMKVTVTLKDTVKSGPIEVWMSQGEAKEGASPEVHMHLKGISSVYSLEANPFSGLQKDVNALREHELFRFPVDRVQKVILERAAAGETITISRQGESWTVNEKSGDKTFINQFLSDLSQIRALDFPIETTNSKVGDDFGFGKPLSKITVSINPLDKAPGGDVSLIIGNPHSSGKGTNVEDAPRYAGVRSGVEGEVSEVFTLSKDVVTKISPRLETLVTAEATSAAGSSSAAAENVAP